MALVTGLTIYTSRIAISMGNRALSGKRYSTCSRSHLYSLFMVSLSSLATLRGCRCEMSTVFLSAKLANQKLVGGNVNRCSLDSFPSLLSLPVTGYLYSAWHQIRNALYWFCIANPSGDPFSFASWCVWAGRANTQTHLVQSVSVSDLLNTVRAAHTVTRVSSCTARKSMEQYVRADDLEEARIFFYTYMHD